MDEFDAESYEEYDRQIDHRNPPGGAYDEDDDYIEISEEEDNDNDLINLINDKRSQEIGSSEEYGSEEFVDYYK